MWQTSLTHAAEPSVEELIQLQEDDKAGGDDDDDADDDNTDNLLKKAENLTALFTDQDPILERSWVWERNLFFPIEPVIRPTRNLSCTMGSGT